MLTKNTKLILLLLLLSIPQLSATEVNQATPPPEIVNISHEPYIPIVNETVLFTVNVKITESQVIDNVTLNFGYGNPNQSMTMTMNSTEIYTIKLNFSKAGTVGYFAELYDNNQVIDNTTQKTFQVLDNRKDIASIVAEIGDPLSLSRGNYSIKSSTDDVELNLTATDNIKFVLNRINQQNRPVNTNALSNIYEIEVNNTQAINNISLSISYNTSLLDELGTTPENLVLQKRENDTQPWKEVNSTLDISNNRLITHPKSFSQWLITSSVPLLKFVKTTTTSEGSVNSFIHVETVIGNLGGSNAENIAIKMIIPQELTTANSSLIASKSLLGPMQNISLVWIFSGQSKGEYNIVAMVESQNAEGDITEIQLNINESISTTQPNDDEDFVSDDNSANFLNLHSFIPHLLITGIIIVHLGRRKRI